MKPTFFFAITLLAASSTPGQCISRNRGKQPQNLQYLVHATWAIEVTSPRDTQVTGFSMPTFCRNRTATIATALHRALPNGAPSPTAERTSTMTLRKMTPGASTRFTPMPVRSGERFFLVFSVPLQPYTEMLWPRLWSGGEASTHWLRQGNIGWRGPVRGTPWIFDVQCTTGQAPRIVRQPSGGAFCPGRRAVLSVVATGTAPMSYQWRHNGRRIVGANASSHVIANLTASHAGSYDVVIRNRYGAVTSNRAGLKLYPPTRIFGHPVSRTVCVGQPVTFRVSVDGATKLQWRRNGADIPGAHSFAYTIPAVTSADAGDYDVVVGGCTTVVSRRAALRVGATCAILVANSGFESDLVGWRLTRGDAPVITQHDSVGFARDRAARFTTTAEQRTVRLQQWIRLPRDGYYDVALALRGRFGRGTAKLRLREVGTLSIPIGSVLGHHVESRAFAATAGNHRLELDLVASSSSPCQVDFDDIVVREVAVPAVRVANGRVSTWMPAAGHALATFASLQRLQPGWPLPGFRGRWWLDPQRNGGLFYLGAAASRRNAYVTVTQLPIQLVAALDRTVYLQAVDLTGRQLGSRLGVRWRR